MVIYCRLASMIVVTFVTSFLLMTQFGILSMVIHVKLACKLMVTYVTHISDAINLSSEDPILQLQLL